MKPSNVGNDIMAHTSKNILTMALSGKVNKYMEK
jgi:hypothetical protein